ncbi:MAG: alanyl-tRNA editing protein [Candidatus Thorarchaeota archaeon]|nr:alanyl-tRNA editing protein [Candidatus Thorarchaeota archaeon]
MTELLYMRDNYIREFEATIIGTTDNSIILDRTAFYPEGGGQIGDKGTIQSDSEKASITSTKKIDGAIHHIVEGPVPFTPNQKIVGRIDWDQRYECMRFHTAQHILSRYLQLHHGLQTVGNQITCGNSRADYSPLDSIGDDMKLEVQDGVNSILKQNLDVLLTFMPRKEATNYLKEKGYQFRYLEMVPKSVTEFRIISVGAYDAASCAGTHVANTSEIGEIRLGKTKNVGAGKRRLYFSLVSPRE